ncbi:MAG: GNAT family N-acetyltransferase [Candidatus Promineifilaceae bacterium]
MNLVPADCFSLEALTAAYNQTRVDYIVPMPMNVVRLREYVEAYDVALDSSWVAVVNERIVGLGMLGLRPGRGWVTRVGVLPGGRRRGIGRAISSHLLASALEHKVGRVSLEVIKGNRPGLALFRSGGFEEARELIIARRPPSLTGAAGPLEPWFNQVGNVWRLSKAEVLPLLGRRDGRPNWLNETESLANLGDCGGLYVELRDGGQGWVAYQMTKYQLTHITLGVEAGDPAAVSSATLAALHDRCRTQDAIMENLPAADPTWQGYLNCGYFETFRRIEMSRAFA